MRKILDFILKYDFLYNKYDVYVYGMWKYLEWFG